MLTYGSVCSGIEAASVAWEPLGFSPTWFSQYDPEHNYRSGRDFPSELLQAHWPHVPNLGDMTGIASLIEDGIVEAPSILVGGTPCQAFSVAGARQGLADERGALTIKYVELLDVIDKERVSEGEPEGIAVWENVPGVLSSKDNAFGAFLGLLAGEDCELQPPRGRWSNAGCVVGPQRTIAWRILDAQYFGVAQRRRRVFVVASARKGFNPTKVLFESEGLRRDIAPSREAQQEATTITRGGVKSESLWDGQHNPHPTLNQSHNTGGIGSSNQEVFSQRGVGLVAGHRMTAFGEYADDETASTMCARDYKDATDLVVRTVSLRGRDGGDKPHALEAYNIHENQRGEVTLNNTSGALNAGGGKPGQGYPAVMVKDTERQIATYGVPGNWIGRKPENGGNATTPMDNIAPCLTSTDRHAVAQLSVRRLTPIECERLQGFPDNHTQIPWRNKPAENCPDGHRYKAIGNSMAVPVMQWIGRRIQNELSLSIEDDLI